MALYTMNNAHVRGAEWTHMPKWPRDLRYYLIW